ITLFLVTLLEKHVLSILVNGMSSVIHCDKSSNIPVMCEVCGTYFETRRGLSSHARLHLRQLGVTVSESSGAPIDLLYQLIRERDGCLPNFKADSSSAGPAALKKPSQQKTETPSEPEDKSASYKAGSRVVTTPAKMDQGSPARLKESAAPLLPSSPSGPRLVESRVSEDSSSSGLEQTPTKPLWAPLETDRPITLDTNNEVHVCQLCGCWYETRKGLSSHARAHLRHIGVADSEIKGSPIDLLYRIMEEEDLKPINSERSEELTSSNPPKTSSKRPSSLSSPPSKRPKTSEDSTCILCGEKFENRKGLACHARSHLNHLGMVDLPGKSSAIDTLQELVSSGVLEAVRSPKTKGATSSSAARALSPIPGQSRTSYLSPSPAKSTSQSPFKRAPKAKKGFRLAVDPLHRKPKPEPLEIEVFVHPQGSSMESNSLAQKSPAAASSTDVQSPPTVLCDFCGQLFDTRKALSCHARAHLRQLGLTWSIKTSPIDLLKEVMMHGSEDRKESVASGSSVITITTPFPDLSNLSLVICSCPLVLDTSCELCGFDFENRKALASHARAHLRQLGIIEWKADGATSPIELLSELIRRDPAKVAAITRRYRMGDLYIKKVGCVFEMCSQLFRFGHKQTRVHPPKYVVPARGENSQQPSRSGSIPALLPKPPLTPLVKLVGKVYSLKCRFCEEVFHGPLSVQEQWITHLQKHILSLGYKGKASPPAAPVAAPALVHPVAV
uniref:WIZ zinc finger a n=1 Tax=Sparus aurata TaxID=8175 RepID=A0A671XSW7_SPAAU